MELNNQQIEQFNRFFENGGKLQKGLVYLDGYRSKSLGLFGKKKLIKSTEEFKKCLEMVPNHWQSMVLMAKSYQRLEYHDEAFELLEKAFQVELENSTIPLEASLEAMHLGKIEKAIFYSEEAIKRAPDNFALVGNHAMNLLVAEKDNEAKEYIERAIQMNPNDQINRNIQNMIVAVTSGKKKRPTFKDAIG